MTRLTNLALLPLLIVAGCSVTDENNGATTLSIDENRIDAGADALANQADQAAAAAGNAIENAGPAIENSAADIKERAGRVADKAKALGDRVEARIDDKPVENSTR